MNEYRRRLGYLILATITLGGAAVFASPPLTERMWLAAVRFLTGFARFLARNLPAMSPNAATWVPGVASFVIGTAVLHLLIAAPLRRKGCSWDFTRTLALAMILPVLFLISFIIPGILLHAEALAREPWFQVNIP